MNKSRLIVLGGLLAAGIALSISLYLNKTQPALQSTLAPAFQVAGKSTAAVERALTRVIPIDELDEKEYGDAIAARYEARANKSDPDYIYVNDLMTDISHYAKKPLNYRVFIMNYNFVNAFALPGGVILVTRGLLNQMQSEAQLVAVLAHEMGHVERGHCLNAVKYELLARKLRAPTLGKLADFASSLLLRHSFGKTQEHEADEYAWELILQTQYDPRGVGGAFQQLAANAKNGSKNQRADLFRDYFMSHPPLPLRVANFRNRADMWWRENPDQRRYMGIANIMVRKAKSVQDNASEWTGP